jgi:hypothetical protein
VIKRYNRCEDGPALLVTTGAVAVTIRRFVHDKYTTSYHLGRFWENDPATKKR